MVKRCIECGGRILNEAEDTIDAGLKDGPAYRVTVKAEICATPQCGAKYYSLQEIERAELAAALKMAENGELTGRTLGCCRTVLGLPLERLARLYRISPRLLERIESQEVPLTRSFADPIIARLGQEADAAGPLPEAFVVH